jgi:DNA mismatch repair protein MSH4
LAGKVGELFGVEMEEGAAAITFGKRNKHKKKAKEDDLSASHAPHENTVVKFLPRSYFDQTKGADLLRKLSRPDTYNATLVEEYILLSSSYAILQYAQLCLGAGLSRHSLTLDVNTGGSHRMNMDRATMVNLELLVNAKSGKTAHSLVGSIDCTKTSVGGKLLRTNLMAPPTRLDTIHARLDLVDAFLEDEEFFYVVMEHLEDLPDVDKMLSCVALVPRGGKTSNGALLGNGEGRNVSSRVASRGISALVCIKSTLSVIPSFAHVLEVQLEEMDEREGIAGVRKGSGGGAEDSGSGFPSNQQRPQISHDDESTTVVGSEQLDIADSFDEMGSMTDRNDASMTKCSSLDIGLGTNASSTNNKFIRLSAMKQTRHQLLRAILIAMKQPALSRVLDAVTNIFTESTAYSKNSHAMRHQECFALKPNTDGMMDVLRKAFLANVDDIYRLADEYAETYDISVQVRETTARGYYLSVSADLGLDLPQIFIQPVKNGRFIHCTTEEVRDFMPR